MLARRHDFDPADNRGDLDVGHVRATLMFGRMVGHDANFFLAVGFITLALGGVGVMNIMLIAVASARERLACERRLAPRRAYPPAVLPRGLFLTR